MWNGGSSTDTKSSPRNPDWTSVPGLVQAAEGNIDSSNLGMHTIQECMGCLLDAGVMNWDEGEAIVDAVTKGPGALMVNVGGGNGNATGHCMEKLQVAWTERDAEMAAWALICLKE
jgi:hypothetical protein